MTVPHRQRPPFRNLFFICVQLVFIGIIDGKTMSEAEVKTLKASFQQSHEASPGFTCRMIQQVISPVREEPIVSQAKLHYRAPGMLYISYDQDAYLLVIDDRVYQKTKDMKSAQSVELPKDRLTLEAMLLCMFSGDIRTINSAYTENFTELSQHYQITHQLKLGEDQHQPQSVIVTLDKNSLLVESIELHFPRDFGVNLTFSNYRMDMIPDVTLFEHLRDKTREDD